MFESSFQSKRLQTLWARTEPQYDDDGHKLTRHGALMERYEGDNLSNGEAAIMATMQSGYWPDWLALLPLEAKELHAHCRRVWDLPAYGTPHFGGVWYTGVKPGFVQIAEADLNIIMENNRAFKKLTQRLADARGKPLRPGYTYAQALEELLFGGRS